MNGGGSKKPSLLSSRKTDWKDLNKNEKAAVFDFLKTAFGKFDVDVQ